MLLHCVNVTSIERFETTRIKSQFFVVQRFHINGILYRVY